MENEPVSKTGESSADVINFEREKLELEKQRLQLDIRKERTSRIQIALPVVVSVIAILASSYGQYQQSRNSLYLQAAQLDLQYRQLDQERKKRLEARLELFKKLTVGVSDLQSVKGIYTELFPEDAKFMSYEYDREYTPAPSPTVRPLPPPSR
jgi:hypothetical protein